MFLDTMSISLCLMIQIILTHRRYIILFLFKNMSPLLFIIVMEAVIHNMREGLPWEMLYADDLVLVGKCEEELKEKLRKWNE